MPQNFPFLRAVPVFVLKTTYQDIQDVHKHTSGPTCLISSARASTLGSRLRNFLCREAKSSALGRVSGENQIQLSRCKTTLESLGLAVVCWSISDDDLGLSSSELLTDTITVCGFSICTKLIRGTNINQTAKIEVAAVKLVTRSE